MHVAADALPLSVVSTPPSEENLLKRTLNLKREYLDELTTEELATVAGAYIPTVANLCEQIQPTGQIRCALSLTMCITC